MSVNDALAFVDGLELTPQKHLIADRILKEIKNRLGFLQSVGLQYLTLSRAAATLSGGESQRIRLATQIGSSLMGVLYILDEPSIGLHQRDNDMLLDTMKHLRDLGNTLLVVEHDEDTMRAADYIVDIGPGAGVHGGEVVAAGTAEEVMNAMNTPGSITGDYLSGRKRIPVPTERRKGSGNFLTIRGAAENNLRGVDVSIPWAIFTCVTAPSAPQSPWSTIPFARLAPTESPRPGLCANAGIEGEEFLDKVIDIDQSPIRRTPAPTRPPIPACSTTSVICSPPPPTPRPGATARAASPSMSGVAARLARRRPEN